MGTFGKRDTLVCTLEMATRAKTQLILILAEPEEEEEKEYYADYQKNFQAAADKGLVELVVCASANERKSKCAILLLVF